MGIAVLDEALSMGAEISGSEIRTESLTCDSRRDKPSNICYKDLGPSIGYSILTQHPPMYHTSPYQKLPVLGIQCKGDTNSYKLKTEKKLKLVGKIMSMSMLISRTMNVLSYMAKKTLQM